MALFNQSETSDAEVDASTPHNGSVGDRTSGAATQADAVDGDAAPAGRGERLLPRRGPGRALLKRIYYSWGLRTLAGWPLDLLDRVRGQNDSLLPPRRLRYVGRGDFETVGIQWREQLVVRQALTPVTDFLDIGCGVGRVAVALAPVLGQGNYEGFDIVPRAIRWCQREITPRHPSFTFTLADVRNDQYNPRGGVAASEFTFPYPDESFDVALAASVFTHMRPAGISRYLAEAERVLRHGGRLLGELFVVDALAEEMLARERTSFALDHEFCDESGLRFLGSDRRLPEYNVGIHEADLRSFAAAVGLDLEPIEAGRWSGRPSPRFSDLVTLVKP